MTKKYTAEEKLLLSLKLYHSAKELKAAALRMFYPKMSEEKIKEKVREIFSYAKY